MLIDRNGNKLHPGDAVEVIATVEGENGASLVVRIGDSPPIYVPRDSVRIARGSLNEVEGVLEGGRR